MKLSSLARRRIHARPPAISTAQRSPAGYSIDSRTLQPGELFFAVRGERLDGHDYVEAALAQGRGRRGRRAPHAVPVRRESATCWWSRIRWLRCSGLGAAVRRLWGKPLIGVTGSAGKTTTKECIAHVLGNAASRAEVARQSE